MPSEFYSLRRNAITDLSAFFGFLIGFLGSAPIAWPYLQVGFQTQEIVKGFTWFIAITFGSGVLLGMAGLGIGRGIGWMWENAHKVVRRARGRELALAASSGSGQPEPRRLDARPAPLPDAPTREIRYAARVPPADLAALFARAGLRAPEISRLERAMERTLNVGAFDEDTLVGALRVLTDGQEWSVVTDIVVDPRYRRRGIGRELMRRAAQSSAGKFAVARIPPGTEGFFRRLDALPAYDGFVRGPKERLQ